MLYTFTDLQFKLCFNNIFQSNVMHSALVSHTRSTALILAAYDACIDTQHNQQMSNLYVVAQKVTITSLVIDICVSSCPVQILAWYYQDYFFMFATMYIFLQWFFLDYPLVARNLHCCNTSVVQSVRASFWSSLFCQPVLLELSLIHISEPTRPY